MTKFVLVIVHRKQVSDVTKRNYDMAPIREDFNPTGLYSQEKFIPDKTGVTCPARNKTMISDYNEKEGTTIFYFKKEICKQCSLKDQCAKQEKRTITIGKHHELIMEAKEYNKTQERRY